ncbi:hypothetical protein MKX08_003446 [Trichoderma sp. CBMAI-0020]|nr:hypothetical protein MKX08_003446 [Trichoderma sp. CBMAI-0020]
MTSLLSAASRRGEPQDRSAKWFIRADNDSSTATPMDRLSYCGIAGSSSTSLSRPNARVNLVTSGQKATQAWHSGLERRA